MTELKWTTRTIEQQGIELPWQRVERYGPVQITGTTRFSDCPPKGTVLNEGVVFIPYETLWEVAERTSDNYLRDDMPPSVDYHQHLALVQAGLADEETRGGIHGTKKLRKFVEYDG